MTSEREHSQALPNVSLPPCIEPTDMMVLSDDPNESMSAVVNIVNNYNSTINQHNAAIRELQHFFHGGIQRDHIDRDGIDPKENIDRDLLRMVIRDVVQEMFENGAYDINVVEEHDDLTGADTSDHHSHTAGTGLTQSWSDDALTMNHSTAGAVGSTVGDDGSAIQQATFDDQGHYVSGTTTDYPPAHDDTTGANTASHHTHTAGVHLTAGWLNTDWIIAHDTAGAASDTPGGSGSVLQQMSLDNRGHYVSSSITTYPPAHDDTTGAGTDSHHSHAAGTRLTQSWVGEELTTNHDTAGDVGSTVGDDGSAIQQATFDDQGHYVSGTTTTYPPAHDDTTDASTDSHHSHAAGNHLTGSWSGDRWTINHVINMDNDATLGGGTDTYISAIKIDEMGHVFDVVTEVA